MIIRDIRAEARAYMAERGLRLGYYWARAAGTTDEPQPVLIDDDGFVWVLGWDSYVDLKTLEIGRRIEPPEMPGTIPRSTRCAGCGTRGCSCP